MTRRFVVGLVAAVSLSVPASASAGKLWIATHDVAQYGGVITYHDIYFGTPYDEVNDLTVRRLPDGSVSFADTVSPITLQPDSQFHELNAASKQWGCLAVRSPAAACWYQPGAPSQCELIGPCYDEAGYAAGFAGVSVSTGSGDDRVSAADGSRERIFCGDGDDTVAADASDAVAADCEHISLG